MRSGRSSTACWRSRACRSRSSSTESRLRPSDVPALCGDATRLRTALGWAPSHPLERTLADTLEYHRALGAGAASA